MEQKEPLSELMIKIFGPAADQIGNIFSDQMQALRFRLAIGILKRAKERAENHNIPIKNIPIKVIIPLLEGASLEEDESMKDLWVNMLVNLLNAEENFNQHIFPYILSQISRDDYEELLSLKENEDLLTSKRKKLDKLRESETTELGYHSSSDEYRTLFKEYDENQQSGFYVSIDSSDNLERLKLIKQTPPKIYIPELLIGGNHDVSFGGLMEKYYTIEAEYDIEDFGFRITELGKKFLAVCSSKLDKGK